MSEIALTLLRLGFLALLWFAVAAVLLLQRRDLKSVRTTGSRREVVKASATETKPIRTKLKHVRVVDTDGDAHLYPLVNGMTFGRGPNNSIVLQDDFASTTHSSVSLVEKNWTYTDLGSTNGSWIGRRRITEPVRLRPGSEIRIGSSVLRFDK